MCNQKYVEKRSSLSEASFHEEVVDVFVKVWLRLGDRHLHLPVKVLVEKFIDGDEIERIFLEVDVQKLNGLFIEVVVVESKRFEDICEHFFVRFNRFNFFESSTELFQEDAYSTHLS